MLNGFILVNKEVGITSFKLADQVRRITNAKKSGHNGTLDVSAEGLMLIGLGNACKLLKKLEQTTKTYIATIEFGLTTDTLDRDGKILGYKEVDIKNLNEALEQLAKQEEQIPPMISSIKVNGKKLMAYQRENKEVEIKPRKTKIISYELLDYKENKELTIKLKVEKGYYVRSFARDLGELLNTYGIVKTLKRIAIDNLNIKDSFTLAEIKAGNYELLTYDDVYKLPKIKGEGLEKQIRNGAKIKKEKLKNAPSEFYFTLNNEIVSIYKLNETTDNYEQEVYLNGGDN